MGHSQQDATILTDETLQYNNTPHQRQKEIAMAKAKATATKVTLTATVDLKTGAIYASPSALRKAGLQANAKDKGVSASYTDKEGKLVEYKVYSVLDATKATVKKPASKGDTVSAKDYEKLKALLEAQAEMIAKLNNATASN